MLRLNSPELYSRRGGSRETRGRVMSGKGLEKGGEGEGMEEREREPERGEIREEVQIHVITYSHMRRMRTHQHE